MKKLGKLPARHDARTLQMAQYLAPGALPKIPSKFDWTGKVRSFGEMLNNQVGDCTIAAAGHLIQIWTANDGVETILPDSTILSAYSAVSGYDPATGDNDNGAVELDVLKYWRTHGIGGHKIQAFVALEPANHDHVKAASFLFGGCYIGLALPLSAQNQKVWAVPSGGLHGHGQPGSWGGHAVPVVAYDAHGLTVVTWGALQRMTWGFWRAYTEEAYAVLSHDFLGADSIAPNSFDLAQLQADLKLL